jgi:hypothetical protein
LAACGVSGARYHEELQNSRCGLPGTHGHPIELKEQSAGQYLLRNKFSPHPPTVRERPFVLFIKLTKNIR